MGNISQTTVEITADEYKELIECQTRINITYDIITREHEESISICGEKAICFNAKLMETALGYMENENHFENLKKKFMNKENEDGR